jgi:hypothetical protein
MKPSYSPFLDGATTRPSGLGQGPMKPRYPVRRGFTREFPSACHQTTEVGNGPAPGCTSGATRSVYPPSTDRVAHARSGRYGAQFPVRRLGPESGWRRGYLEIAGAYPAAARSASDSPPQTPNSRCSRAQPRHGATTSQWAQKRDFTSFSRTSRSAASSPNGAWNSFGSSPRQRPRSAHAPAASRANSGSFRRIRAARSGETRARHRIGVPSASPGLPCRKTRPLVLPRHRQWPQGASSALEMRDAR